MYGVQSLLNHCVALTDIVRGTSVAYRGVSYLSPKCPFPWGLVPLCNMSFLGPISLHLKQYRSWFSRFFSFFRARGFTQQTDYCTSSVCRNSPHLAVMRWTLIIVLITVLMRVLFLCLSTVPEQSDFDQ